MARAESAETAEKNRVGHRLARRRPLAGGEARSGQGDRKASPYLFFSATSAISARDWF